MRDGGHRDGHDEVFSPFPKSVRTRLKGLIEIYKFRICLTKHNIVDNFQASTTRTVRLIILWLWYSVEVSLDTQVLEAARPSVSSVSTKNPTRCRMPQACNRISLCSELEYSLHVYGTISSVPTRCEEMETQVLVRYFDKAGLSALVKWCSCSSDDLRVIVLTGNTLAA